MFRVFVLFSLTKVVIFQAISLELNHDLVERFFGFFVLFDHFSFGFCGDSYENGWIVLDGERYRPNLVGS